jgi:poly-D-alanine transfer protein DltD
MRHVFGFTIKEFNYEDKIEDSLRLDYRILANTSNDIQRTGDVAVFYIAIMNNNFALKLSKLSKEFENLADVEMYFVNPDYSDFKYYMKTIGAKVTDMGSKFVIPPVRDENQRRQMVKFAEKVGKRCLRRHISIRENNVQEVKDTYAHPSGLNWAYYGIIPD